MKDSSKRRLAWLAVIVVASQFLTACCGLPWYGPGGRGGHYDHRGR